MLSSVQTSDSYESARSDEKKQRWRRQASSRHLRLTRLARVPVFSLTLLSDDTMHLVALFIAVGVALPCVVGVTVDSLPISANLRLEPGVTLVDRDRARFGALFKRGKGNEEGRAVSVGVKNTAVGF